MWLCSPLWLSLTCFFCPHWEPVLNPGWKQTMLTRVENKPCLPGLNSVSARPHWTQIDASQLHTSKSKAMLKAIAREILSNVRLSTCARTLGERLQRAYTLRSQNKPCRVQPSSTHIRMWVEPGYGDNPDSPKLGLVRTQSSQVQPGVRALVRTGLKYFSLVV